MTNANIAKQRANEVNEQIAQARAKQVQDFCENQIEQAIQEKMNAGRYVLNAVDCGTFKAEEVGEYLKTNDYTVQYCGYNLITIMW